METLHKTLWPMPAPCLALLLHLLVHSTPFLDISTVTNPNTHFCIVLKIVIVVESTMIWTFCFCVWQVHS